MKKILMMCCFVLGISAVSFAQGRMQRSPEEQAKNLQTQLKLDDAQTAKVTAIYQMQAKQMDSVRTAANGDRQTMMQTMRPMREATTTKIKALLTADQAAAYDKMMAEMRNRMGGGQGGNGGGTPPPSQK